MQNLLNPKSVAIIGVSREPGKIGYIIFDNLKDTKGKKIFGVNPNADNILGEKIYPSVLDIEEEIDLAIITVPDKLVVNVLESCGKKQINTVIIISSGFSEAGESGKEKEKEIINTAKKHGIRILGPNCLGVINNFDGFNASFATAKLPAKYRVGIFSQSGAMGAAILDFANGNDFGFSYFVSLGNKSDISEKDLISDWVDDENVELAIGYLEDIKDGLGFLEAAKNFTSKKPLIILKGGMSHEGSMAANLHTAALAQDEKVFEVAMEEAGVILAKNLSDLFELAISFSQNPLPKGKNLAVISNAGGPSVLAADACSEEGVTLPGLSSYTTHQILSQTNAASVANPIDLRGDATSDDFSLAIELCEKEKSIDGMLIIATPQAMTEIEEIAWKIVKLKQKTKKPIYVNFIGGELVARAKEICLENGISVFSYPERAIRAFGFQSKFKKTKLSAGKKQLLHQKHKVAKSLLSFSNNEISSARIISLLNLYGIPMAENLVTKNTSEVVKYFNKLKKPIVMKILSPDIIHKTDVGGIVLGITTEEEAIKAFEKITSNVKKHLPKAKILGVTMMETAEEGLELIVGAKKDKTFGPVVVFGAGGIYVELISDVSMAISPFDREKFKKLIEKTSVSKIIKGYRKNTAYNEKKLIDALVGIGQLITEHSEIESIEINPLILTDNGVGAIGLDAKIKLFRKDMIE